MRTELLEAVARVITVSCPWVRVADTTQCHPYAFIRDGHICLTACRHLTLEVTRSRGQRYAGHRWQVAEFEMDRVLSAMARASPGLWDRCKSLRLTAGDVETLIKRASYGVIDLGITGEDFVPLIYRH